ncbi:MAG: DUF883 domain-containing protein [Verrucomicrobia bacterium]|nr:DUF883 domain-containing protein [Verrucomicrobiota bacterium]
MNNKTKHTMDKHQNPVSDELHALTADAQALLSATANVAEDKVVEARKRLSSAIEKGKEAWSRVQETASDGVKATDDMIRKHPYEAIGLAFGLGALVGYVLTRRD